MVKSKRNSIFSELSEYCHLSGKDGYIDVTEWSNGEGFDVCIDTNGAQMIQMTWGQFDAIKKAVKKLMK